MNAFLRLVAWVLALALVALPVVAVINGWIGAERWPLRRVMVTSRFERVSESAVRDTVLPFARRGFFAVDLAAAQTAVARLPWVERAEVRKQWPDKLIVQVVEHRPFAWWGEDRLLSERGRIFPSRGVVVPKGLPRFEGPESRSTDLVALYNESRAMFAAAGIDVRALRLDARGSWAMTLSNGAEVLIGRDDARLRLERFARMLPQVLAQEQQLDAARAQRARALARADLRYTNGFALSWASAREQADGDTASAAIGGRPARNGRAGPSEADATAPGMATNTDSFRFERRTQISGFST